MNDVTMSGFITQALLMYPDIAARSRVSIPPSPEISNRIFLIHG